MAESGGNRILVVCTGNICRSPLAEYLLRHTTQHLELALDISSAGTGAMTLGHPPQEIVAQGKEWGFDLSGHRPRQLDESLITSSDLILTAERGHRAAVVELVPTASRKVFTLRQFARISASLLDSNEQAPEISSNLSLLLQLTEEIADHRALTPPPASLSDDDIPDPYLRNQRIYDESARIINDAVVGINTLFTHRFSK